MFLSFGLPYFENCANAYDRTIHPIWSMYNKFFQLLLILGFFVGVNNFIRQDSNTCDPDTPSPMRYPVTTRTPDGVKPTAFFHNRYGLPAQFNIKDSSGAQVGSVFARTGETATLALTPSQYTVSVDWGPHWHGKERQFGFCFGRQDLSTPLQVAPDSPTHLLWSQPHMLAIHQKQLDATEFPDPVAALRSHVQLAAPFSTVREAEAQVDMLCGRLESSMLLQKKMIDHFPRLNSQSPPLDYASSDYEKTYASVCRTEERLTRLIPAPDTPPPFEIIIPQRPPNSE